MSKARDIADLNVTILDSVEASATADQTNAEIRAAVEAATDSNVFTDADHTKLNGINQGVATTDSPTFVDVTATSLDISGDIDVDGTTNLDVVDIDGAVDMASTLTVGGLTTVKTDGSGYAIKIVENSGSENYQVGVDSYGGLVFYNETTKAAEFNDTGGFNTYGNVIFNEAGADLDFRVESDGNANMLFVDGGTNRVGIGKTPTAHPLEVEGDVQMRALNTSHGLYDLVNAAPNGFPGGVSADTWHEITNVDWNNYHTADNTHDHFCIALFWTSGITNAGYNHRIRIYVPNFSSNLDNAYRGTVANTSYATNHRDYDGSLSPTIFASHHTGVGGNGNFKFDARFNHQGSGTGQQPLRLQVKTNSPPLANSGVSMKVWRL